MPNTAQVNNEWARLKETTIEDHLKEVSDNTIVNHPILAMLQKKGKIKYGCYGLEFTWRVAKNWAPMVAYGDADVLSTPRRNYHATARMDYAGYVVGESVTEKEQLANRGKAAIVNFTGDVYERITNSFLNQFPAKLYIDGPGGGTPEEYSGFLSCLGVTSNAQYTLPSDTYAGITTGLGDYGGAALSGSWPTGRFDPEYHFWSPLTINYTHASWSASTDTWPNTCVEALRAGIAFQANRAGKQGKIDLICMNNSMYVDLLNLLDDKEQIMINRGAANQMVSLGFTASTVFDGVEVTSDYDCPATEAFGLNFTEGIELRCMHDSLVGKHKDQNINQLSESFAISHFGNLKLNPRCFVHFDNIT